MRSRRYWVPSFLGSLALALALLVAAPSVATFRPANGMITHAFFNAILINPRASMQLVRTPLSTLSAQIASHSEDHDYLKRQLRDERAQVFMMYLVRCALEQGEYVEWVDPIRPSFSLRWEGQMGLCPAWRDHSVEHDSACQEQVSACLLALNNPRGKRVLVSLRQQDHFTLRSEEDTDVYEKGTHYHNPRRVASFDPCPGDSTGDADCGWLPAKVGWCEGNTIDLEVRISPELCEKYGPEGQLRICPGIHGCTPASSEGPDYRVTCHTKELQLECPPTGYFSVMARQIR